MAAAFRCLFDVLQLTVMTSKVKRGFPLSFPCLSIFLSFCIFFFLVRAIRLDKRGNGETARGRSFSKILTLPAAEHDLAGHE